MDQRLLGAIGPRYRVDPDPFADRNRPGLHGEWPLSGGRDSYGMDLARPVGMGEICDHRCVRCMSWWSQFGRTARLPLGADGPECRVKPDPLADRNGPGLFVEWPLSGGRHSSGKDLARPVGMGAICDHRCVRCMSWWSQFGKTARLPLGADGSGYRVKPDLPSDRI
jgi:hypothetical protein